MRDWRPLGVLVLVLEVLVAEEEPGGGGRPVAVGVGLEGSVVSCLEAPWASA